MDLKNTSQKSSHPASTLASHQETNATRPLYGVLMLHGPNISASNVNFVRDTLDNNHLPSIEIGNGIKQIFMEKIRRYAKNHLTDNGHVVVNIHGTLMDQLHALQITSGIHEGTYTHEFLNITARSQPPSSTTKNQASSLPMFHLLSCLAGHLRDELKPGTPQWQANYVVIYSNKKETAVEVTANALESAMIYLGNCRARNIDYDPFKLFYLAGANSGSCLTLLGGQLEGPLIWHAPKNTDELDPIQRLNRLQGSPTDRAEIILAALEMQAADLSSMPPENNKLVDMFFNRIIKNDVLTVKEMLTQHPILLHERAATGFLPLMIAIDQNANLCTSLLIERGADIHCQDHEGWTPLMSSANARNPQIMRQLIENHVDIDLQNHRGNSALMLAAQHGHSETMSLLLESGANPHLINNKGHTALLFSILAKNINAVNLLLKENTMVTDSDPDLDPLTLARTLGNKKIIQALEKALRALQTTHL